jgi:hypothetical protein
MPTQIMGLDPKITPQTDLHAHHSFDPGLDATLLLTKKT